MSFDDHLDDLVSIDMDLPAIPRWQMLGILFAEDPNVLKKYAEEKRKEKNG